MKIKIILVTAIAALLLGCSGSTVYRGSWKAMDPAGNKFQLQFEADSFIIREPNGVAQTFHYKQNSVAIENSTKSYGIQTDAGRQFKIVFPNSSNPDNGFIKDESEAAILTLNRKDYVKFEAFNKLQ